MNISVQELTSVDKEVTIKASREDLASKFDEAFKKYRKQIQMPGFRTGKVPLSIVKKRFGEEIEMEEINKYVQEVFEEEVVPEHEPVGETEMTDFQWENDELEVKFKIGSKPEFELQDLGKIDVDKLVHDVTDEEVEEEIERTLEREGNWEEIEGEITEDHRVTVDAMALDEEGNPVEGEKDEDQVLNLKDENAKEFREFLIGKKAGDAVDAELGEGEEKDRFRLEIKKAEKPLKQELTDEFAKEQSNGEAKNVEEYKSFLKSRMQEYYDQTSDDMFRQEVISALTDAHDFEVPDVFEQQVLNNYVEYLKQQSGNELPPDFDEKSYKNNMRESAVEEAKWVFINQKLQDHFEDIEIKPEDIDAYIAGEAARYGATTDQMKSYFAQNPKQLESLRSSIRENKIFEKLKDAVNIREISKEELRKKREKKDEEAQKTEA
ncbi:MAG: trigger factor [Balneolaceae bacterium]